jgi:predicted NUDIX family NTP pyrophosphohydrolase
MKESAGTLLYRRTPRGLEVLIVHPSGAYNRNRPWSIPKGLLDDGEDAEAAARRETEEEAGVRVTGDLVPLGHIDYTKSPKRVHCFAGAAPADARPQPDSWEMDRAEFMLVEAARKLLHPEQAPFVDRLIKLLGTAGD